MTSIYELIQYCNDLFRLLDQEFDIPLSAIEQLKYRFAILLMEELDQAGKNYIDDTDRLQE